MGELRCGILVGLALTLTAGDVRAEGRWRSIFNGRDLEGWVAKVNHHRLGENYRNTFRASDGLLRVSYEEYPTFKDEFAHLIYRKPLSSYRLRLEYRFVAPPTPGAPAWAIRNSGVMIHGQAPREMGLDQNFPISVEAQLLGGAPGQTRPTGNVCTPGTTVTIDGVPLAEHCRSSTARTYPDGQWVRFEVEVHGSRLVRQFVDGEPVLEYGDLRLNPAEYKAFGNIDAHDPQAATLVRKGAAPLERGYISLQGEGHPVEFRRIELMELRQ